MTDSAAATAAPPSWRHWLLDRPAPAGVKVPLQITGLFWAIKICSTAMGEALADWLDGFTNVIMAGAGILACLVLFGLALRAQLRARHYHAARYWFAVAMVATFGTMVADVVHEATSAPYWSTTLLYAVVLVAVLWRWRASEGTLSIHSISTRRRESFYWGTVLATFALGTAAGDWTAGDLNLGFFSSALLFTGAIIVPAALYWAGANAVATFWSAYVLTRPLGASYADWFDYAKNLGGLGVPHPAVFGVLAAIIVCLVGLVVATDADGGDRQPRAHTLVTGGTS